MLPRGFRITALVALLSVPAGARLASAQHLPDIVTTDVLRVCSDPGNMPFSDRKGDGFDPRTGDLSWWLQGTFA